MEEDGQGQGRVVDSRHGWITSTDGYKNKPPPPLTPQLDVTACRMMPLHGNNTVQESPPLMPLPDKRQLTKTCPPPPLMPQPEAAARQETPPSLKPLTV